MIVRSNYRRFAFLIFVGCFVLFLIAALYFDNFYLAIAPFLLLLFYWGWQATGSIFLLLLFSLPFSSEFMITSDLGADLPDELLMMLVSFLSLSYWIYHPQAVSRSVTSHPIMIILLISFSWSIFSTIFSNQPIIATKYLLAKSWYFGSFVLGGLIVFRRMQSVIRAGVCLILAMGIVAVIILIRHAEYQFSFFGINNSVLPFFRNHVNYSSMLVCLIPVAFVYWRSVEPGFKKNMLAVLLIIFLTALIFTYARGAWLALVTGIGAVWLIHKRMVILAYISIIMLAIGSLFYLKSGDRYLEYAHDYKTTIWHQDFGEHLVATYKMKDASTAERFYRWIAGVRMIKDEGLTGYGPNSFYNNYKPYTVPAFKTWVSENRERSTIHNYFLLLTVEQGIPALVFFLLLAGAMLYYAQQLYHSARTRFYKNIAIVTGPVTVMILTVNFLSDLIETDKVGSIFYLCLSLLIVAVVGNKTWKAEV
jgi:O-antigen ligase